MVIIEQQLVWSFEKLDFVESIWSGLRRIFEPNQYGWSPVVVCLSAVVSGCSVHHPKWEEKDRSGRCITFQRCANTLTPAEVTFGVHASDGECSTHGITVIRLGCLPLCICQTRLTMQDIKAGTSAAHWKLVQKHNVQTVNGLITLPKLCQAQKVSSGGIKNTQNRDENPFFSAALSDPLGALRSPRPPAHSLHLIRAEGWNLVKPRNGQKTIPRSHTGGGGLSAPPSCCRLGRSKGRGRGWGRRKRAGTL